MENTIADDFEHGKNFKIGKYCTIQEGCKVGDNVDIQNYVLLKKGTIIGNNVYVDSYFRSSGDNKIGNNVVLRFGATIAREVTVEDGVFISPNVMTIYSTHESEVRGGIVIGKNSYIGTNAVLNAGVKIAHECVIGSLALVSKDCPESGVYVGIPARKIRDLTEEEIKELRAIHPRIQGLLKNK
ncbi:MAG: acyltransferase [Candidatus Hermodarchaeota archaeon]